jgi:hypothetical protein
MNNYKDLTTYSRRSDHKPQQALFAKTQLLTDWLSVTKQFELGLNHKSSKLKDINPTVCITKLDSPLSQLYSIHLTSGLEVKS